MTDTLGTGVSPGTAAGEPPPASTPYDDIATKVLAGISQIIQLIPAFEPKHPETQRFVRRYQTFSNEVIRSTIAAVEANPELNSANKFNVQEARATLQFLEAFGPVIDQTAEFLANLRFTYGARKARMVADSLQTYAIAKGIGRDPASAGVAAHTANIKRDLRRPKPKKLKQPLPIPKTQ